VSRVQSRERGELDGLEAEEDLVEEEEEPLRRRREKRVRREAPC
jgi:hypothetical protein